MRIVKEGETRTLLCHNCGKTSATYRVRDVAFSDKRGTVKNILAAVCDRCDEVAAIPAQSTARIKEAFDQSGSPLEIRVPVHYLDILYVATQKIDTTLSENFNKALILWYLHALTSLPLSAAAAENAAEQRHGGCESLKTSFDENHAETTGGA